MNERRPINIINSDVNTIRKVKVNLQWTPEEIATDMLVVANQLTKDIEKYLESGQEASCRRVRSDSKIIETLGKSFRVQSLNFFLDNKSKK
jgi:hypothetical protein